GPGERRQESLVGPGPAVANCRLVDDVHLRRRAVDDQRRRQTVRGQGWIGGDVFPEIPEVLAGERRAVGPAMSGAQMKGEYPPVLDVEAGKDIRDRAIPLVIDDEARV